MSRELKGNWGRLDPHPGPLHSAAQSQVWSETQSGDLGASPQLSCRPAPLPHAGCLAPAAAGAPFGLEGTCLLRESSASRVAEEPLRTKAIFWFKSCHGTPEDQGH